MREGKVLLICLVGMICAGASAFGQSSAAVQAYIDKYRDTALEFEKEYGIPAPITLAQGILESAAGTSSLTKASNNHFCIKAGKGWNGRVHLAWDDETVRSRFRCYNSPEESFRDYAILLSTGKYYRDLFKINIYDYRGWAHGLKKAGYATAPNYAQALIGLIEHYKLYAVNGGVKLRPGRTVVITRYVNVEKPVFEEEDTLPEDEVTDEEAAVVDAIRNYVVDINDIHCTVIQPGEDLASISRKYDISPADLLKYNELASERQVREGNIIFLDKKKKRYSGARDVYVAKGGESLHDVSQSFGIQLRRLARLNDLPEYILLEKGMRINLK